MMASITSVVSEPIARLSAWRRRQHTSPGWTVFVAVLAAVMLLPVATIVVLSLAPGVTIWPHLMRTVLPAALADTVLLLIGVSVLVLAFGTATAWLVTMYRFPGRAVMDRLLVLPLAVPTYIVAYCYVELLDFSGPVQRLLRLSSAGTAYKDYWFPDMRRMGGATIVLSACCCPYVS